MEIMPHPINLAGQQGAQPQRHHSYNDAIDFIRQPPADCRIRLIYPPAGFRVGRMTTDKGRLELGYRMGWQAALDYLAQG
jgi:predicted patatin/cPLA2 family phospholipase